MKITNVKHIRWQDFVNQIQIIRSFYPKSKKVEYKGIFNDHGKKYEAIVGPFKIDPEDDDVTYLDSFARDQLAQLIHKQL